jgi:nitrate reductase gamma subunit
MNIDLLLFGIAPYVVVVLAVAVAIYRYRVQTFTYSSLSSQFLESKLLFWGSVSFHWGIVLILTGHFMAFLLPSVVFSWNAAPLRLYLLEGTGLALGLWALAGLLILTYRRLTTPRIQAVSTGVDLLVLVALLVSVVTGVLTALTYRWGSNWFAAVASPYLWSVLMFNPKVELLAGLPALVKTHIAAFYAVLAIFPFSRLVHIVTVPLGYLWRPWQIVIWNRRPGAAARPGSLRPGHAAGSAGEIFVQSHEAVPQLKPRAANGDTKP